MASSDDFKAQLKAGNITEALATALSEAVELKFTTWVASGNDVEATEAKPGNRLRTRINSIEGEVEHEIGEEFIGTGRYRELRQFHLDQVAEGSKIIQNNLKSLQKLFEVLVALRYGEVETPGIEPKSFNVESQILPPVEEVSGTSLGVEAPESAVMGSVASPELASEDIVAESVVSPKALIEEPVVPVPSSPAEQTTSFLTAPTEESEQALEEEMDEDEDEDWDASVLDLLESLPVVPPPAVEESDSDLRSDLPDEWGWEDLSEEEPQSTQEVSDTLDHETGEAIAPDDIALHSAAPNLEIPSADVVEDWGDFVDEEPKSEQALSDSSENRDIGTVEWDDFASPPVSTEPNIEAPNADVEEDWGDFADAQPESELEKPVPNIDSLNMEEDEEWDDWVMEEPEPLIDTPVIDMDVLDLDEDEDWGDLVDDSEPLSAAPTLDETPDLSSDEDWDNFADEELEASLTLFEQDREGNTTINLPAPEAQTPTQSSTQNSDRNSEAAIPENYRVHSLEEIMFDETLPEEDWGFSEESEPEASAEDFNSLTGSREETDAKAKSVEKRVPPPPPPGRFSPSE